MHQRWRDFNVPIVNGEQTHSSFRWPLKRLGFYFCTAALSLISISISAETKVQLIERIHRYSDNGQCDAADGLTRQNFGSDTSAFILLAVIENDCRRNVKLAIEYLKLGAKAGDVLAADLLRKLEMDAP